MFETNFYQNLLDQYFNYINSPKSHQDILKIGGPIQYYLADSNNNLISTTGNNINYILDVDITSAFPTIIQNLFNNNSRFIQTLNTLKEKKEKNIYIATTLKGEPLQLINQICKMIICGIIFDTNNQEELENITILELKKDGCLISCPLETINRIKNLQSHQNNFTQFVINHNFNFHFNQYSKYIRCNRTSFLLNKSLDNLSIKGVYKHIPIKLKDIVKQTMLNNYEKLEKCLYIYTTKFFKILQKHLLTEYLNNYYICSSNRIINKDKKYVTFNYNSQVNPKNYLKIFVNPVIITNNITDSI